MNSKKQSLILLLLMMLVAAFLVACGSSDDADNADGDAMVDDDADAMADDDDADAMADDEPFVFGLVMVGPEDDRGWNQAHMEAAEYVLENNTNTELVSFDKLNIADNPDLTLEQVIDNLVDEGAQFIFTNSAEMADGTNNAAATHPDVNFIHISGDDVLTGDSPANVGNLMGQMEFGKMMAGCAAAMTTETGNIAYLGPLIDAETRRLVNSTYLGARYCYENNRGLNPDDLTFSVTWIGFWFNIPGVTLDPTQVVNDFIDNGADVIISGIDTTEAVVVAGQRADAGENVFAVPYDFIGSCEEAPQICLGVPYFNWGPEYLRAINATIDGTWEPEWIWGGPDWSDINNLDTSLIGWVDGPGLSSDGQEAVQAMIDGFADGSLNLFTGPLNYQDGTALLEDGEVATDEQIWYAEQLLDGVIGSSE